MRIQYQGDDVPTKLIGRTIVAVEGDQSSEEGDWLKLSLDDGSTLYVDSPTLYGSGRVASTLEEAQAVNAAAEGEDELDEPDPAADSDVTIYGAGC